MLAQELDSNMNYDSETGRKLIKKWKWHLHTHRQHTHTHIGNTMLHNLICSTLFCCTFENITIA